MPNLSQSGVSIKNNGTLIVGGATCINFKNGSVSLSGNNVDIDLSIISSTSTDICIETTDKTGVGETSNDIKIRTGNVKVGEPVSAIGNINLITGDNDGGGNGRGNICFHCNASDWFDDGAGFQLTLLRGATDVTGASRGQGIRSNQNNAFGIITVDSTGGVVGDLWFHTGKPDAGFAPGIIEFRTGDAIAGVTSTGDISFLTGTPLGGGTKGVIKHNQTTSTEVVWESGATGSRPGSPIASQRFYDTTLTKPIWFDGAAWKDASGAAV